MKKVLLLLIMCFVLFLLHSISFWYDGTCAEDKVYVIQDWLTWCCPNNLIDWMCNPSLWNMWIRLTVKCLLWYEQCGMNIYKILWIQQWNQNPTVLWLFQDIVLAATTFVWTVIVIVLIVSGLIFAFWSITWKDTKRAKTIVIDCFVWLLLVMWSYTIIRLIQFLATAW